MFLSLTYDLLYDSLDDNLKGSAKKVLLAVKDLSVSFVEGKKSVKAIEGLGFTIEKGETLALLGESGCGKSLTALSVMQLLSQNAYLHSNSAIHFLDKPLLDLPESKLRQMRGKEMAMIFQEPMTSLNPVLTIGKQLSEVVCREQTLSKAALQNTLVNLLKKVDIPSPERQLKAYPHQLSGGQMQRVMIAMAIAGNPALLIADEPTTALDVTVEAQILALLKSLQGSIGMAMLLITHDLSVVRRVADKVCVMYAGEIVESAPAERFFSSPSHPYSKRLLACLPSVNKREYRLNNIEGVVPVLSAHTQGCRFKPRCLDTFEACEQHPPFFEKEASHFVRCHYYDPQEKKIMPPLCDIKSEIESHVLGTPILKVNALKVYYPIQKGVFKKEVDVVKAVDGVSFQLHQGETLALVGESGCGKSTLARALIQLEPITSGDVFFKKNKLIGEEVSFRQAIQIVFQDPFSSMNPRMLVEDIIMEGARKLTGQLSEQQKRKKINELLSLVGLPSESAFRYPHQFSGGQRQRISIARALAVSPEIIICDEPTSALDVSVQAQILNLLRDLQRELNLSYLFISHDMAVVSYLAERIMVMREGKIIEEGQTEALIASPKEAYTQALLSAVG
jgi:peptide/nickel transport system ATP-binding protein